MREARIHVRHVRDLLKSADDVDAYNGVECASPAYLGVICQGDVIDKRHQQQRGKDSIDCTPPDYILPSGEERPLLALHPTWKDNAKLHCLKVRSDPGVVEAEVEKVHIC